MVAADRASTRPVREQYAARLVAEGVVDAGRGGRRLRADAVRELREAHERLKASIGASAAAAKDERVPDGTGEIVVTAVAGASGCATLNEQLLEVPDGFTVHPKLAEAARAPARRARRAAGSTGARPRRSPSRASLVGGDPGPAHRPGHRARHVRAPPPRPPRRRAPASCTRRSSTSTSATASFEVYNSPLSEYACARLRVRLLDRRARRARALGGAVRRLRQRRADRHRPVHRRAGSRSGGRRRG